MRDSNTDHSFRDLVDKRILALRDEFFEFMWDYTGDFRDLNAGQTDPGSRVLINYFWAWTSRFNDPTFSEPDVDRPAPKPAPRRGREFEEFNQLLPLVLLTVIDAVWKNPEVIDANPRNPDGSRRIAYHRRVDYLLTSPPDPAHPNDLKDPNLEEAIDQLSQGDWPSITSSFED